MLVTAATSSDDVVSRRLPGMPAPGRVVVVGDVGLDLKRHDMYEKELELRMSTSYGPGRYDPVYEDEGRDYPYGYVRWTEGRNMEEYLRLLARAASRSSAPADGALPRRGCDGRVRGAEARGSSAALVLLEYPTRRGPAAHGPCTQPSRPNCRAHSASPWSVPARSPRATHVPNLIKLRTGSSSAR